MGRDPQAEPQRLLLVDDEQDILDFLERALRRRYQVHRFSDPVAALAEVRAGRFDVVITDQRMPAVTGLEIIEEVAQRSPDTVRVLISGYTEAPEIAQALVDRRIHNFVLKPIDSMQLLQAIDRAAARAQL
ncbi:MAG TPA: response regulator [Kofleriaceae bacterium]|nr:response regulator [Kofleriaceae bacterium]